MTWVPQGIAYLVACIADVATLDDLQLIQDAADHRCMDLKRPVSSNGRKPR